MIPTKVAFEQRYSDDSGVEFGVSFDSRLGEIKLEAFGCEIGFPVDKLGWLIESLEAIRAIRSTP